MANGYLALILHAHLPFVRHPEYPEFLEEDWLFEAITETYLPLLDIFHRLVAEEVDFRLTMSLTPTLCSMLRDPLLQQRYIRYLGRSIELAHKEIARTQQQPELLQLAQFYLERLNCCLDLYETRWKRDLVGAFAKLQEKGVLEIITCAATHGFLPLMQKNPEAIRAQILIARDNYRECFGRDPQGIWLPECGYTPGIESFLQEANIRWFAVDTHGLLYGEPKPRNAMFNPCYTSHGLAAFARDRESSKQVWSAEEGYPGDPAYRDFYRDIGFDLSIDYLRDFLPPEETRKFTGFKYHRITGRTQHKDIYNRAWAMGAVDAHAGHFMQQRVQQVASFAPMTDAPPIIISPFDAELFGHWWYEGPEFLDLLIRKTVFDQQTFALTTPSEYLKNHPTHQSISLTTSSWGHNGYAEVWLDKSNDWIYPHLHVAAKRMTETARNQDKKLSTLTERTLRQMARELLLAQSSDWAFLMKTGTAASYAAKRTKDHLLRFTRLYDQLRCQNVDDLFLKNCEERDNLFPNIDWRYYA